MEPRTKRARLLDLGKKSHITGTALATLLRQLAEEEIPEHFSRKTQQRQKEAIVFQETSFGRLLQCEKIDGETDAGRPCQINLWVQHPFAFLEVAAKRSISFARFLAATWEASSNEMSLVFYTDEVTPGNPLAESNERKIQAVYWTWTQIGYLGLSSEDLWFTLAVIRTSEVAKVKGGMSAICKHLLKYFLGRPSSRDLRDGILFHVPNEAASRVLHGDLSCMVQDERAHTFAVHCKGSGGHNICALCRNVVADKSSWLPDASGFLVSGSCLDVRRFVEHTDSSLAGVQALLLKRSQEGVTKGEFELLEQQMGFIFEPASLMQDLELGVKLRSIWCWDWLHVYLASGIFSEEVKELLSLLSRYNLGGNVLNSYLERWQWPKGYASGSQLCKKGSHQPSGQASVFLSAAPVLRHWLKEVVVAKGILKLHCESLMKACDVLDLLQISNSGLVSPIDLGRDIVSHLTLQQSAWGLQLWRPKSHWAMHLPKQLLIHGQLISCFLAE
eukprot:9484848-Pyramimonas_sp.AAC.1